MRLIKNHVTVHLGRVLRPNDVVTRCETVARVLRIGGQQNVVHARAEQVNQDLRVGGQFLRPLGVVLALTRVPFEG